LPESRKPGSKIIKNLDPQTQAPWILDELEEQRFLQYTPARRTINGAIMQSYGIYLIFSFKTFIPLPRFHQVEGIACIL
jgi:hypothetical protein